MAACGNKVLGPENFRKSLPNEARVPNVCENEKRKKKQFTMAASIVESGRAMRHQKDLGGRKRFLSGKFPDKFKEMFGKWVQNF